MSSSTCAERSQYGEDLAVDYCKCLLGFKVIARDGATRGISWIWAVRMLEFWSLLKYARAANTLVGGYHSIDKHKKRVLQRGLKTYINCKILLNTSVLM